MIWSVRLFLASPLTWFSTADLSAIDYSWSRPASHLIRGCVFFFGYYSRPLGRLPGALLFAWHGLDPVPWLVFRVLLAAAATAAIFFFAARLSRSREVAVFAALLAGCRTQLFLIWSDSTAIPETLALILFCAAFLLYLRHPTARIQLAVVFIAALDCHETALVFPLALLLYEATLGTRRFRAAIPTAAIAATFLAVRLSGFNITGEATLPLQLSASNFLTATAHSLAVLLFAPGSLNQGMMAAIFAVCMISAAALRNRLMLWATLLRMLALLPSLLFPSLDGSTALLLPLVGWGLFGAALLSDLRKRFAPGPVSLAILTATLCVLVAWPGVRAAKRAFRDGPQQEQFRIKGAWDTLAFVAPGPWNDKHILALHDPLPVPGTLQRLARLGSHQRTLRLDAVRAPAAKPASFEAYDFVVDFYQERFVLVQTGHPAVAASSGPVCTGHEPLRHGVHDNTDPRIAWFGTWTQSTEFPTAWDGTVAYTNAAGAAVCWNMEGVGFRYTFTKAFNRGTALVTVDGQPWPAIDLYSPAIEWQASRRIEGLTPGPHRVTIQPSGNRNEHSSDSFIDLDAVEVF